MLKSLHHKSIVSFVDLFVGVDKIHLVTSFVEEAPLSTSSRTKVGLTQPIARYTESACATLRRVLDVFCYLHNREGSGLYVLYRDLKPENM